MQNCCKLSIELVDFELSATDCYERVRSLPYALLLDSNTENGSKGRFDIICADPLELIVADPKATHIISAHGQSSFSGFPLDVLRSRLAQYPRVERSPVELPFTGGALGLISYDFGRRIERLPSHSIDDTQIPLMAFGIYCWAIVRDNQRKRCYFVARPECGDASRRDIRSRLEADPPGASCAPFLLTSPFQSNLTAKQYQAKYHRIMDYIHAGDCYQVNLAQRFSAGFSGDPWLAYKALRKRTDAAFSAYLDFGEFNILSLTPERFLRVVNNQVETKPIKGTRPRNDDPQVDRQNELLLINSSKDKAENLMIVDLLRNDLSKACRSGTVQVPHLFEIEAYSNVFHLVSTVTGELSEDKDAIALLEGCFPGGSITGAPKVRAMEIIEELEPHRRGAYCGSVAYINFSGELDSSIAIRTLVCREQQIFCWGGGGIVADSDMEEEYRESIVKVSHLLNTLSDIVTSDRSQFL